MQFSLKITLVFAFFGLNSPALTAPGESEMRVDAFYLSPKMTASSGSEASLEVKLVVDKKLVEAGWLLKDCLRKYVELKVQAFRKFPSQNNLGEKLSDSRTSANTQWISKIRGIKILHEPDIQKNGSSWELESGFLVLRVRATPTPNSENPYDLVTSLEKFSVDPILGLNGKGLKHPLCKTPIATDSFALIDQIQGNDVREWVDPARMMALQPVGSDSRGVSDSQTEKIDPTFQAIGAPKRVPAGARF